MSSLRIGAPRAEPAVRSCALDPVCRQSGFAVEFTRIVCKSLKINCTFQWYRGYDFGDVPENGTDATGMLGAIQRGEFDTFVPIFTPTARRIEAVAFSDAYYHADVVMITRQPIDQVDLGLLNPIEWPVWCCFFFVYVLAALLVTVAIHGRQSDFGEQEMTVSKSRLVTYLKALTALVICEYRRQHTPRTDSMRILLGFWTLGLLVLTSAYTGVLFSHGVSPSENLPYTDMEGFVRCLEAGKCRMIANSTSTSFMQVLTSPESDFGQRILKAQVKMPLILAPSPDIPRLIQQDSQVFLVWMMPKDSAYNQIRGNECAYYILDAPYKDPCAFAVRKGFPLLANLSRLASIFHENGLTAAIMARYRIQADCGNGNGFRRKSTWQSCTTVMFYLYVIGVCSALATGVFEIGAYYGLKRIHGASAAKVVSRNCTRDKNGNQGV